MPSVYLYHYYSCNRVTVASQCFKTGMLHSLIDWITDTRSQGCTDLQSLVKCLDHRGIVLKLDTVYTHAVKQELYAALVISSS